jgi:hypothetical protein
MAAFLLVGTPGHRIAWGQNAAAAAQGRADAAARSAFADVSLLRIRAHWTDVAAHDRK